MQDVIHMIQLWMLPVSSDVRKVKIRFSNVFGLLRRQNETFDDVTLSIFTSVCGGMQQHFELKVI